MSFVDWIKEKSGDDAMKYVLAGGLVLVIVIAMWGTISSMFGGQVPEPKGDNIYYDLDKDQSYELTEEQRKEHGVSINEGGSGATYNGQPLYWSPLTNEFTGIPMIKCPKCEELYRKPQYADPPQQSAVCPHCGTNLRDYRRKLYLESK